MHNVSRLRTSGVVALAMVLAAVILLAANPRPAQATNLCGNTGSSFGPFDLQTYEAGDWRTTYSRTFELAGFNRLFPDVAGFALPQLETGPRSAGSGQLRNPYIPPTLLKAIAWIEASWSQADNSVAYGAVGPVLISHDCGYGITQVTTGMQNTTGAPGLEQAMIGGHYAFNIARGARILAEKWNAAPTYRPIVGSRDPLVIENWYYALWSYNGFTFKNHPLNPGYSLPRPPYRCDGTQSRSNYPYQELVLGCVANPPVVGGAALWNPIAITLPNLSNSAFSLDAWNACRGSFDCGSMDIPTPSPSHTDPTNTSLTRSQVIGSPALSVSTGQITLVTVPPVQNTPASLVISNIGTGPLTWRISSSASWLAVSRAQGVALGADLGSQALTVTVQANPQGLPPGRYTTELTIESLWASGAPATVSITLHNYPDGALLKKDGDPTIYVMQGGLRRPVSNAVTFWAQGYQWGNINVIPDSSLASIPEGQPLLDALDDGVLLKTNAETTVYVMQGGVRRPIASADVLLGCGYGWDAVYVIPDAVLGSIASGSALTGPPCPQLSPADGVLLKKDGDPTVYVMQGGVKRPVPNAVTFWAQGYQGGNINVIPDSSLASIPEGQPLLDALADGVLLKTNAGITVYVMQGGARRPIANADVFLSFGYGWDAVYVIPDAVLGSIASGSALTGPPRPEFSPTDGVLLKKDDDPTVYVMQGGLRRFIPNLVTFWAQGYQGGNVNVIPGSSLASIPEGQPLLDALADGVLLKMDAETTVYVMQGGVRRPIANADVFLSFDYSWDAVYVIPDAVLGSIASGSALTGPPRPEFSPTDGVLLKKDDDPTVYVMKGGLKRLIPNAVTFWVQGYQGGNINVIPASSLASIPEGQPLLDALADGVLLKTDAGITVYVMQGGVRRPIDNAVVFFGCGYGWDAVYVIPDAVLGSIPSGSALTGSPCPQFSPTDGVLLKKDGNPTVYVMLDDSKLRIASEAAFSDCGYADGNVNIVRDSMLNSISGGATLSGPPCP